MRALFIFVVTFVYITVTETADGDGYTKTHNLETSQELPTEKRDLIALERNVTKATPDILNSKDEPFTKKRTRLLKRLTRLENKLTTKKFKSEGDKNECTQKIRAIKKELERIQKKIRKASGKNRKRKSRKRNKKRRKKARGKMEKMSNDAIKTELPVAEAHTLMRGDVKEGNINATKLMNNEMQKKPLFDVFCKHKRCHRCVNGTCICSTGFKLTSSFSCIDINECLLSNGGCEHICQNRPGYHNCLCPTGRKLSYDNKQCIDLNECLRNNGHGECQDTCRNTDGSYFCTCEKLNGTRLAADKHKCEDIDECAEKSSGCSHNCYNIPLNFYCTCPSGMILGSDGKTCEDINECLIREIQKKCNYNCQNTIGSYRCVDEKDVYADSNLAMNMKICPVLQIPKIGYYNCTRPEYHNIRSYTGRLLMLNAPGSICNFMCPKDYKPKRTVIHCTRHGKWQLLKRGDRRCLD